MTSQGSRRTRPQYEGDPTLTAVMRKPKWIGALLLALLVAGVFAWLGQWQLGFAITLEDEQAAVVEEVRPLTEVTGPGEVITDASAGFVFSTSGEFVSEDFMLVESRSNDGEVGSWVVGHLITGDENPGHLAVALGWAPSNESAQSARAALAERSEGARVELVGRYMPGDAAVIPEPGDETQRVTSMAPAQLVNLWQPFDGLSYPGFLVLHPGDSSIDVEMLSALKLDPIDSVPPLPVETINWLNLFYAVEWVVFAGFAVFFWYRLVRDDWEKIHELQLLSETAQQ